MNPHPQQNFYPQQPPQQFVDPSQELSGLSSAGKITLTISIILFWIVALALPAYSNGTKGAACLFFGWSMLFTGNLLAFLSWIGNIPFLIGFCMFAFSSRKKIHTTTIVMGAIAFLFSFGALTVTKVHGQIGDGMEEVSPDIGTIVWMMSSLLLLIASIVSISLPGVFEKKPMYFNQQPMQYPNQNYYQQGQPYYQQPIPQQQQYILPNPPIINVEEIVQKKKEEENNLNQENSERPDPFADQK